MINIARAIQHPFEDRDWVTKFLIGAGVSLVPVLNFAMLGYSLDVLRNTEQGRDTPLPSWNDLGNQFVEGLKLWVAQLLYVLPIIGLSLLFAFGSTMLGIAAGSGRREAGSAAAAAISFGSLAFTGLAMLYALAIVIITPALYIQVARARTIGAAFDFRAITTTIRQRSGRLCAGPGADAGRGADLRLRLRSHRGDPRDRLVQPGVHDPARHRCSGSTCRSRARTWYGQIARG